MNLYRNIDRGKIQFDFAVHTSIPGDYDDEIRRMGGRIIVFPQMRRNPIKYNKLWDKFWRENHRDYIAFHFHTNSLANIIALKKATKYKLKYRIVHSHSTFSDKGNLQILHNLLHNYNKQKIDIYANKFFACSKLAAKWLYGKNIIESNKIEIIKNSIDIKKFSYNEEIRKRKRLELGVSDKIVIGHIGKFIPVKNHNYLIEVFKFFNSINSNSILLLVGEGELLDDIKNKVSRLDLADKVIFTGVRTDVHELLQAMDVFVLPSIYEGLPLTLIEAQASGIPILASDNITDEVKIKDNLFFYDINAHPSSWAQKLNNLVYKSNRLADNDALIVQGYCIEDTAAKYERMILSN